MSSSATETKGARSAPAKTADIKNAPVKTADTNNSPVKGGNIKNAPAKTIDTKNSLSKSGNINNDSAKVTPSVSSSGDVKGHKMSKGVKIALIVVPICLILIGAGLAVYFLVFRKNILNYPDIFGLWSFFGIFYRVSDSSIFL